MVLFHAPYKIFQLLFFQFEFFFILNKTPWAHLDIAGMAFSKYGGALNSGGATGYGVRLLNKLIEDDYE